MAPSPIRHYISKNEWNITNVSNQKTFCGRWKSEGFIATTNNINQVTCLKCLILLEKESDIGIIRE